MKKDQTKLKGIIHTGSGRYIGSDGVLSSVFATGNSPIERRYEISWFCDASFND